MRDSAATPREAFLAGTLHSVLDQQRDRMSGWISRVAACVTDDGMVTGELTLEFGGHRFVVSVTEAPPDDDAPVPPGWAPM